MALHTLAGHAHLILVAVCTLGADGTIPVFICILAEKTRYADTVDALLHYGTNGRDVGARRPDNSFYVGVQAGTAVIGEIASAAIEADTTS